MGQNNEIEKESLKGNSRCSYSETIEEKDRLLSLARRDIESLKREIVDLKAQLNCSSNRRNK